MVIEIYLQEFSKTVEIQEYVLPAFFATLKAPVNVPFSDGKFSVTVGAEYTFGQKVEGKALVSFKLFGKLSNFKGISNHLSQNFTNEYLSRLQFDL